MARLAKKQNCLNASYYRGGTSRALFFREEDLPQSREQWKSIFCGTLGAPDPNGRQLDGLGGGISSLSKICVVGPSERPGADVDYTFAQVGVKDGTVDYSANCGNMTSAVGPFAFDTAMVDAAQVMTGSGNQAMVKIYNTNTDKIIHSSFAVGDGEATASGSFSIDGVAGTGSPVQLQFMSPAGAKTGKLLPTGNLIDVLDGFETTCIDVSTACVFVKAKSLGFDGSALPDQIESHPTILARLESIRQLAAVAMGLCETVSKAPNGIPKIGVVSKSLDHPLLSGKTLGAASIDLVVRVISMGQPHRAIPITVSLAVAAAAKLSSSVVADCVAVNIANEGQFTIGHPSGKVMVGAQFDDNGGLKAATVYRTARRLMEGKVFWK